MKWSTAPSPDTPGAPWGPRLFGWILDVVNSVIHDLRPLAGLEAPVFLCQAQVETCVRVMSHDFNGETDTLYLLQVQMMHIETFHAYFYNLFIFFYIFRRLKREAYILSTLSKSWQGLNIPKLLDLWKIIQENPLMLGNRNVILFSWGYLKIHGWKKTNWHTRTPGGFVR